MNTGLIRMVIGLFLTMGAVGGFDDPSAPLLPLTAVAFVGLGFMYWATVAINRAADQTIDALSSDHRRRGEFTRSKR